MIIVRDFSFLFTVEENSSDVSAEFLEGIKTILRRCSEGMELSLYTTVNYKEKIVNEKVQRCYLVCSENVLPLLQEFLQRYHANELPVPPPVETLYLTGMSNPSMPHHSIGEKSALHN